MRNFKENLIENQAAAGGLPIGPNHPFKTVYT